MILSTMTGGCINTDQVRKVIRVDKQTAHHNIDGKEYPYPITRITLEWANGDVDHVTVDPDDWNKFQRTFDTQQYVLPSPAGYTLLSYFTDERRATRWPILAWRFNSDNEYHSVVTAITGFDDFDEYRKGVYNAILCPDGRISAPGDQGWESEEEWLRAMEARIEHEAHKEQGSAA